MVIACQNNSLAFGNGNPATWLQGLSGLINEDCFKAQLSDVAMTRAHQRTGNDLH